jgi:CII-binding regulator of phage lambda lysogenization HflD
VTSPVINTRYALQNNSLSKNVYINCSIILNELCDENVTRCKNIGNFIQLIRVNILKELTENHFNNSHKELLTIREKISSLKSSLTKYNTEAEERAKKLASLFGEQSENITNKF